MPKLLMTDCAVAGLAAARQTTYFDTKTRGLALRVGPRSKTWFFVYRNGGAPEWLKLGAYPAVKLAEARDTALIHRHDIDIKDVDPAVERRKEPEPVEPAPPPAPEFTFADFVPITSRSRRDARRTGRKRGAEDQAPPAPGLGSAPAQEHHAQTRPRPARYAHRQGLTLGVNRIHALSRASSPSRSTGRGSTRTRPSASSSGSRRRRASAT